MGKVTGFMEIERKDRTYRDVHDRVKYFKEFVIPLSDQEVVTQAARCMDCGIPYCHTGCPVNNQIPDWNDLVYQSDWQEALRNLHSTNNFPEFTGRICPAPCEAACTLNLDDNPVTIKTIECAIIDKGFEMGWVKPEPALHKTGKRVAIVGSGPAGLAAAQQLCRAGYDVDVYEKNAYVGGLLRYGIPDFKLEKHVVARRVTQIEEEGVNFICNTHIGSDKSVTELEDDYDAVLLTGGSEQPRDLNIEGRDLDGVHFAMEFLTQQNRRVSRENVPDPKPISAKGKHVIVIGGGDTGSDCIGTSFRQGAASVHQLEIMPVPPVHENKDLTWPNWPLKFRTSTSQAEGAERDFSAMTTHFSGVDGRVTHLHGVKVDETFQTVPGTEFETPADLVLLAMGFVNPIYEGMLETLNIQLDPRKNVLANDKDYKTSRENIFVAGDMRRGQSLVVWAIREGRQAAHAIDAHLMGYSDLPR